MLESSEMPPTMHINFIKNDSKSNSINKKKYKIPNI